MVDLTRVFAWAEMFGFAVAVAINEYENVRSLYRSSGSIASS